MSNSLTNFFPTLVTICNEAVSQTVGRIVMAKTVAIDYKEELKEKGETVRINIPDSVSTSDYEGTITPANATSGKVDISLDNHVYVAFDFSNSEMAKFYENPKLLFDTYVAKGVDAIVEAVEDSIIANHVGILANIGAVGTAMAKTGAIAIRTALEKAKVAKGNRFCCVSTDSSANLLALTEFANPSAGVNNEALTNGELPKVYGLQWMESQYTPELTVADASAAVNLEAGYAAGTSTIAMDGYSGAVPAEGQIVKFANHATLYTVDDGSTTTSLKIKNARLNGSLTTGLGTAVVNDEGISFLSPNAIDIGYHKDAFALVPRPLGPKDGINMESKIQFTQFDPRLPFPVTITLLQTDNNKTRIIIESLWGTDLVSERLAVRKIV